MIRIAPGVIVGIVSWSVALCASSPRSTVGMVPLLANPAAYDGRKVEVFGVFLYAPSGAALCLSKDDVRYSLGVNCIGVRLNRKTVYVSKKGKPVRPERLNGKYVAVDGDVDASGTVALTDWPVAVRNTVRVEELVRRSE
jgi:hypothetical protein